MNILHSILFLKMSFFLPEEGIVGHFHLSVDIIPIKAARYAPVLPWKTGSLKVNWKIYFLPNKLNLLVF